MERYNFDTNYGNYGDFDSHYWADDFYPIKSVREKARARFLETLIDMLDDMAEECGLDPTDWDAYDYNEFCYKMDLHL